MKSNKLILIILTLLNKIKIRVHEKYIILKIHIFNYSKKNKLTKKGLYIDCGSNLGQGYDFFSKYFPITKFDHIMVEPNPSCIIELKNKYLKNNSNSKNLIIIDKAADIKDGTAFFYGLNNKEKGKYSDGASIQDFHNSALYTLDKNDVVEVETFDFSKFINKCRINYDLIVLKMDIEGSEYGILSKLLTDDTAKYLDLIFVEFHSAYMLKEKKIEFETIEKQLIKSFRKLGIEFCIWR